MKEYIQKTEDYNRFKFSKENRPINRGLVNRIKTSIKDIGYMPGKEILVDEDTNIIIDGQHRYTACVELGIPVPFAVTNGDIGKIMINLNAQQLNWKLSDYVHHWADKGVSCYKKLEEFENEYKFGMSISLMMVFGSNVDKVDTRKVKEGKVFTVNPDAYKICFFVLECNTVPYYRSSHFTKAVTRLFKRTNAEQREKIKAGIVSLPQQATAAAYLAAFENIVNKGVPAAKRVSFSITK